MQYKGTATKSTIFFAFDYQNGQWTDITGVGFSAEGFRPIIFERPSFYLNAHPQPGPAELLIAFDTDPYSNIVIRGQVPLADNDIPVPRPVSDFEEEILRNPELFFAKDGAFQDNVLVVTAKKYDRPFAPLAPNTAALWGENTFPHIMDTAGTLPLLMADIPLGGENEKQTQRYPAPVDKIYHVWSPENGADITQRFITMYPAADNPRKPFSFIASTLKIKLHTDYLEAPANNKKPALYVAANINREGKTLVGTGGNPKQNLQPRHATV